MATYKRSCAGCGGGVVHNHSSFKIEHPARDWRGRFVFESVRDKETGTVTERQRIVQVNARGLGHWRCVNGCRPYRVKTERA